MASNTNRVLKNVGTMMMCTGATIFLMGAAELYWSKDPSIFIDNIIVPKNDYEDEHFIDLGSFDPTMTQGFTPTPVPPASQQKE